jgi:hypothetical protein
MEAIELHTKTGMQPHWDFNESIFSAYDWTKEPSESLDELYRKRAQQLRDRYDYLVLWYSSGADSDNILRSFLDNNILLDEVASFTNYEGTHDKDNVYMNGEIYNISYQTVQTYKKKFPNLKHRVIDICKTTVEYFSLSSTKLDWKYHMNSTFNPNSTSRGMLYRQVKEWQDLKNTGKKVGFIWGTDKPRLGLNDDKYYFYFIDIVDNAVNPLWQMNRDPGDFNELFYWSPDLPDLLIKQAHVIKNFLRSSTTTLHHFHENPTSIAYKVDEHGKKWWLTTIGVNYLIYSKYKFNSLNEFKPSKLFWTPRDNWFFKQGESSDCFRNWSTALSGLWNDVPDYWKNNPTDPSKAFTGCVSHPYFLE